MVESNAETQERIITNFTPVNLLILKINSTIQAKKPDSFNKPTSIIIPTRKRITSNEANFITFSKSMVLVISKKEVPINAKPRRKSQKRSVPRIEAEKIDTAVAWWILRPQYLLVKPKAEATEIRVRNFFTI
jgi:hypothetical protein